jgi:hypothetical protein
MIVSILLPGSLPGDGTGRSASERARELTIQRSTAGHGADER